MTLSVTTTSLPYAIAGQPYSVTLAATGGVPAYTWSISAGALPAWAALNTATGVISGTPAGTGYANFTAEVTDTLTSTATQALAISTIYAAEAQPVRARFPQPLRGRAAGTQGFRQFTVVNSFEGGPNTQTLSTVNTGGSSGYGSPLNLSRIFSAVSIASGTIAFSTAVAAHGSLSAELSVPATGDTAYCYWGSSVVGSQTQIWFRQYLYFTANPSGAPTRVLATRNVAFANTSSVLVNTSGQLVMNDNSGSAKITFTGTIPLNQWFRIEGSVTCSPSAGIVTLTQYSQMDSVTLTETHTTTGVNTLASTSNVSFGIFGGTSAQGPYWMDDIGVSNIGPLGPAAPLVTPPLLSPVRAVLPPLHTRSGGQITGISRGGPNFIPKPGPFFQKTYPIRARIPRLTLGGQIASQHSTPPYVPPVPPAPPSVASPTDSSALPSIIQTFPM